MVGPRTEQRNGFLRGRNDGILISLESAELLLIASAVKRIYFHHAPIDPNFHVSHIQNQPGGDPCHISCGIRSDSTLGRMKSWSRRSSAGRQTSGFGPPCSNEGNEDVIAG